MPPLYVWECQNEKCKKKMDVLRDWDGYRDPPTEEEGGECTTEGGHAWKKEIQVPLVTKGSGWGGGKGNW